MRTLVLLFLLSFGGEVLGAEFSYFIPVLEGEVVIIMPYGFDGSGNDWIAEINIQLAGAEHGVFNAIMGPFVSEQFEVPLLGLLFYEVPFDGGMVIKSNREAKTRLLEKRIVQVPTVFIDNLER